MLEQLSPWFSPFFLEENRGKRGKSGSAWNISYQPGKILNQDIKRGAKRTVPENSRRIPLFTGEIETQQKNGIFFLNKNRTKAADRGVVW